MRGLKRFIYSVIGVSIFVLLPCFIIVSNHINKTLHENIYLVTDVSGSASIQYQISRPIETTQGLTEEYKTESQWIKLRPGDKIHSGALINVGESAHVEIMKNNEAAISINENTRVRLNLNPTTKQMEATLEYGKILCRIEGSDSKQKVQKSEKFRVNTPNSVTHVEGTSFSVDYMKGSKITNVDVLEGQVTVESDLIPTGEFPVSHGQHFQINPSYKVPVLSELSPYLQKNLQAARNLQIKLSIPERWEDIMALVTDLPLYHKALYEITKYEMKVFIRAIHHFAPLRWENDVPQTLKSVELEEGDYLDPWGTEYFYQKLGSGCAIMISAGSDKILHTPDDIFMNVSLKN